MRGIRPCEQTAECCLAMVLGSFFGPGRWAEVMSPYPVLPLCAGVSSIGLWHMAGLSVCQISMANGLDYRISEWSP